MDKNALRSLGYGLYIVSSRKDKLFNGQVANTVFQICAEPLTVAVSINKENLTWEYIKKSQAFTVSVLSEATPLTFIGKFGFKSGRDIDKFKDTPYRLGTTGIPIITENTTAYLEAKVISETDVFTHTVFIGEVVDAGVLSEATPMTYSYYHMVKQGKTPPKAATYLGDK